MAREWIKATTVAILGAAFLAGCATWSTSDVVPAAGAGSATAKQSTTVTRPARTPDTVLVTEKDITDRPYESLGDITVTVNKTTIFNADPTPELVNQKLREKAAALGADAVIEVRYGTPGISFMSWGSMDGKGRAVAYK
jgi:uncharacterized protein YbjQ (UPF0145 family)